MKNSLVILASLLAVCTAQVPNLGRCPGYVPVSNFDIERFLGKWYEAERYFQVSELGTRCVVSDYARSPNGKISVSSEVTSRLTGIKRILDGDMELTGRAGEGKLEVKYQTYPITTTTSYSILDTDYDSYAVMWSCSGYGPVHTQNAWVMTRERLAPANVLQKAYGALDKFKISRTFFQKTDQEGCVLAASEINAAQGWIGEQTVTDPPQTVGEEAAASQKSAGAILLDRSHVIEALNNEKIKEVKPQITKEDEIVPNDPKIALKEITETKKEELKKPVQIAQHILKDVPVADAVQNEAKPVAEKIQTKKAETEKAHPKVPHTHKNIAKIK
ncbi:hypothetical protein WA026_004789 [Henosepilachna vigintioctopunctata]|uniref:Lipocalin/cytosolic fatty-acid binding domain-containing protein n=1 Tax=Henosepilachna vigintioctopunctata TaxID=420089 RepID=A0AAW1V347_9CUCU